MTKKCIIGCSHVFGSDLDDCDDSSPSKSVWPNLLFGNDIVNLSKAGASCDTIARRLLLYLSQNNPKLVVIQWPDLTRWEILDSDFQICGKDSPYQCNTQFDLENFIYSNRSKAKFKYLTAILSDADIVKNNLKTIVMINQFLAARNIPVKNFYATEFPDIKWPEKYTVQDITESENEWIKCYKQTLFENSIEYYRHEDLVLHSGDFDPYIQLLKSQCKSFPTNSFDGKTWTEWCKTNHYHLKNGSLSHFEEQAHIDAAELLRNTLT